MLGGKNGMTFRYIVIFYTIIRGVNADSIYIYTSLLRVYT